MLLVKDDLEHYSYGSGLVSDMSSAPCFYVGSADLLSYLYPFDSWRGWLQRETLYSVGLWGQLGSKKPQTGISMVIASFGQESHSFVLCVQILLAQPRQYLLNREIAGHCEGFTQESRMSSSGIHIPGIDDLSSTFNFLLSLASFPNIPPFAWCDIQRLWIKTSVDLNPSFATYPVTLGTLLYSL